MKLYKVIVKEHEIIKYKKNGEIVEEKNVRLNVYDNMGCGYEMKEVENLVKFEKRFENREIEVKEM